MFRPETGAKGITISPDRYGAPTLWYFPLAKKGRRLRALFIGSPGENQVDRSYRLCRKSVDFWLPAETPAAYLFPRVGPVIVQGRRALREVAGIRR